MRSWALRSWALGGAGGPVEVELHRRRGRAEGGGEPCAELAWLTAKSRDPFFPGHGPEECGTVWNRAEVSGNNLEHIQDGIQDGLRPSPQLSRGPIPFRKFAPPPWQSALDQNEEYMMRSREPRRFVEQQRLQSLEYSSIPQKQI